MRIPPPLDVHAHLALDIEPQAVRGLAAYVFAMTRSVDEYSQILHRRDLRTIWGVGTHPGLVRINRAFDLEKFTQALSSTPLVGEVGLDGSSRVPMAAQIEVFRSILTELQKQPRIVSVHSSGAQFQVLRELHRTPVSAVVLHWWTGSPELTEEAVRLGCYFSLPPAMMSSLDILRVIPIERILSETDHPSGDRYTLGPKRPGGVGEVEQRLAVHYGMQPKELRVQLWRNLRSIVQDAGVQEHFGSEWQTTFRHLD